MARFGWAKGHMRMSRQGMAPLDEFPPDVGYGAGIRDTPMYQPGTGRFGSTPLDLRSPIRPPSDMAAPGSQIHLSSAAPQQTPTAPLAPTRGPPPSVSRPICTPGAGCAAGLLIQAAEYINPNSTSQQRHTVQTNTHEATEYGISSGKIQGTLDSDGHIP